MRTEEGKKWWMGWDMARGCGGGRFRVISERVLENSRLVRARVFQKGSSSSLADCPYRLRQFKNTQMIIPGLSCVVMLFSYQGGQAQNSKSGVNEQHGIRKELDPLQPESFVFKGAWMHAHHWVLPQWHNTVNTDMHWHEVSFSYRAKLGAFNFAPEDWLIKSNFTVIYGATKMGS